MSAATNGTNGTTHGHAPRELSGASRANLGGVVCFVERTTGGTSIQRVRLLAAGLSRTWSAPQEGGILAVGSDAMTTIRSAARWVSETLASVGIKRLSCVCLDADGAICSWLSAPSADQGVIQATVMQAEAETGDSTGLGAGRLLAMAAPGGAADLGPGGATSVQALASPASDALDSSIEPASKRGRFSRSKALTGPTKRHRYAVLAMPDAPARVFLDELDTLGVEVQGVTSLWHALARAWDDDRATTLVRSDDVGAPVVAESDAAVVGVVLIQATGGLLWAWSRSGELLAGGTIRLKALRHAIASDQQEPGLVSSEAGGSRRLLTEDGAADEPELTVEFGVADGGRLAMDWLSWSAQLGLAPQRLVVLAPPNATDSTGEGAMAIGRHLARAWPGATIDAAIYTDPVGATLSRLAGLGKGEGESGAMTTMPATPLVGDRPREALVALSTRPGRIERRMHQWVGAGIMTVAAAVGVLGWRLYTSADDTRVALAASKTELTTTLVGLETLAPNISKLPGKAMETLEAKRNDLAEQAKKVRPPRPVLEETVRMFEALEGSGDVRISEFEINSAFNAKVTLDTPGAMTGPEILDRLRKAPGQLEWSGTIPNDPGASTGRRRYILLGVWPMPAPGGGTGGASAGAGGGGR